MMYNYWYNTVNSITFYPSTKYSCFVVFLFDFHYLSNHLLKMIIYTY